VPSWTGGQGGVADLPGDLGFLLVLELVGEVHAVVVDPDLALHEGGAALVPVEVDHAGGAKRRSIPEYHSMLFTQAGEFMADLRSAVR